jgi:hypothetical protein
MKTNAAKTQENKSQAAANRGSERPSSRVSAFQFEDNRPETLKLRQLQKFMNKRPSSLITAQLKELIKSHLSPQPNLKMENKSRGTVYSVAQSKSGEKQGHRLVDNRPRPAAGGLPSNPNGIVDKLKVTQSHAPSPVPSTHVPSQVPVPQLKAKVEDSNIVQLARLFKRGVSEHKKILLINEYLAMNSRYERRSSPEYTEAVNQLRGAIKLWNNTDNWKDIKEKYRHVVEDFKEINYIPPHFPPVRGAKPEGTSPPPKKQDKKGSKAVQPPAPLPTLKKKK